MENEIARLQELLQTGQRLSMQGSYERRAPHKDAMPYLIESRKGLRQLLKKHPESAEAWLLLSFAEECLLNYPAARKSLETYLSLGAEKSRKTMKRLASLKESERKWTTVQLGFSDLEKLGIFVSEQLSSSGCDHTTRFTASWLDSHAMGKQDQLLVVFQKFGGYCDCEILANVITGSFYG